MTPPDVPTEYDYQTPGSTWDGSALVYPTVLEALTALPRGARVLEAGCGNGYFASLVAAQGFQTTAVDPSASGIEVARKHYPQIAFRCEDLTAASTGPETYDAITCIEVIEHVYAPRALLKNFHGLLRPGGSLVLTTPYHGFAKNLAVLLTGRFEHHFDPTWDHGHIKFFTPRSLTMLLSEAGFLDVRIRGLGRAPFLWKTMMATAVSGPLGVQR